jgi:ADP-ribosylglycohydrolase
VELHPPVLGAGGSRGGGPRVRAHPDVPRSALLEAGNSPGDSDSIATLVRALVGARTRPGGLPKDWIAELSARTSTGSGQVRLEAHARAFV